MTDTDVHDEHQLRNRQMKILLHTVDTAFQFMSADGVRSMVAGYSDSDLAKLLRSPAMDLRSVQSAAMAESLARILGGRA